MFSLCLRIVSAACLLPLGSAAEVIRVCADPNNMPFSNRSEQGFENRLARMLAHDIGAKVQYTWWAERKSFLKTVFEGKVCDAVMGMPAATAGALTTVPYYQSSYVFASLTTRDLNISSLWDPRLATLRIGLHVVGEDYAPPAHLLASEGWQAQITGYSLYGRYGEPTPPTRLLEAVVRGDVDIAIVWGPLGGYFAKHSKTPITITPVTPQSFGSIPFAYDISAAIRPDLPNLFHRIQNAMIRECASISRLLNEYGIPRTPEDRRRCEPLQSAVSLSRP